MDKYAEAEIKMNYLKYLQTKDTSYLYKAKELADKCSDSTDPEVKKIVLSLKR